MFNSVTKKQANNLAPVRSLQNQIGRLFDNFFDGFEENLAPGNFNLTKNFHPKVNISETDKAYLVETDLAGLKKEDVKVEYKDNILSIMADKEEKKEEEDKNYHRVEYSRGSFCRSFQLPDNIEQKDINAEMKDGILKITLPKSEKSSSKANQIMIK
jgi:HSP20 family protein